MNAIVRLLPPAAAAIALLALAAPAADAYVVRGRFLYEDRLYDGQGYTGTVQNLPIRHAKVELVDAVTQQALATGTTGVDGRFALTAASPPVPVPVNLFVRCITDGRPAGYELRVVDNFVRIPTVGLELTASQLYAITTGTTLAHSTANDLDVGDWLTQDVDGTGVAQAFNIFDTVVDFYDWMAQPGLNGARPTADQFLVLAWKATGTPGNPPPAFGSNYSQQGVFIGANPDPTAADTDGWSDTVILHETGHWFDDVFSRSDNPGGAHFIGDNDANVKLAYGEGAATFHCAKVREWRATTRTNLVGQPVDAGVSLYADLVIPPPVGTPGGLSFSYDFETGNFGDTGAPIGQRGSANETNVTSALWDMMDGPSTPDATPGTDDDALEAADGDAWQIEHVYLRAMSPANPLTVEDYYQGWFATQGPGVAQAGMDGVFVGLARMPFAADGFEPDGATAGARTITPVPYAVGPAGKVVINEVELGAADAIELMNTSDEAVDLTGWQLEVYANGTQQDATRIYTFPPFTIQPGECVALHEGDDATLNGTYHLYGGDRTVFNASWNPGLDGAVVLRTPTQTAVDFVRWKDAAGNENATPVPAGLAFAGSLDSPVAPFGLARDVAGTDTDGAADFAARGTTLGAQNHPAPEGHTVFATGDADVIAFEAVAGQRYGIEARSEFSASDARVEILSPGGAVLAFNDDSDVSVRHARVDFVAGESATYYARVTHVGQDTDWGEYDLMAFARPPAGACAAPGGLTASADHNANVLDRVVLQWANAAAYDSVRVYRDGVLRATLPPGATSFEDFVDRGLYEWEVSGLAGACGETARVSDWEFAGTVECASGDTFEDGSAELWITEGSTWGVTPFAKSGTWGFTDSPVGLYRGCTTGTVTEACKENAIAVFSVPADVILPGYAVLEFDHICITEATFDFGLVEITKDGGATWTTLAAYDQASDPAWGDNVAHPDDWRHVSIDLSAYAGERIMIRLRLESDTNLEFDGWYVDDLRILACPPVDVDPLAGSPQSTHLATAAPNPLVRGGHATLAYAVGSDVAAAGPVDVSLALYDVRGREVRTLVHEAKAAGRYTATWDATDDRGRAVPAGVYYARFRAGAAVKTTRLVIVG
jgi:hypothetical protein